MNTQSPCSLRVLPDPRRKQAVIVCDGSPNARIALRIADASHTIERDGDSFTVTFDDARCWSPDDPHLYRATVEIADGDKTQTIEFSVGLRQFDIGEHRFRINQRPIPLRGAALRASAAVDPSLLAGLRDLGFNAVRIASAQLGHEWLDAADATGMLVFAEIARDDTAAIEAYCNHPALVAWHVRIADADCEAAINAIRARDVSRLVVVDAMDRDGHSRDGAAANPNQTASMPVQCAHIPAVNPLSARTLDAARGFGARDRITVAEVARAIDVENHADAAAVDDLVRALRAHDRVAGYWVNGPDIFGDAAIAKSVHQPDRPVVEMAQRALLPMQETPVHVAMINDSGETGRGELSLQVVGPTAQVLWKKKRGAAIPKSHKELWEGSVGASSKPGPHQFVVRVMKDRRVLAEDAMPFHVLSATEPIAARVHIVGGDALKPALLSKVTEELDAPVYVIPPLANTVWAYPIEPVCEVLASVQDGAAAIVFAAPGDWHELAACFESMPVIETARQTPRWAPVAYHTGRHPILEGVRTSDTMESSFQRLRGNVMQFGETDESVCPGVLGSYWLDAPRPEVDAPLNDVVIRAFGAGRIIYANYDPFGSPGDPASESLLRNLVEYAHRRAVRGGTPPPFQQAINLWRKRAALLMSWQVLGPLRADAPNPDPPTHADELGGVHDGAYGPVQWRRWWCSYDNDCTVDMADACQPDTAGMFGNAGLTGYAVHTFRTSMREPRHLRVACETSVRVWFNGRLLGSTAEQDGGELAVDVTTREGLNAIAVDAAGGDTAWGFGFSMDGD